jgi:DNA-binding CsgD family transcriptional regulator
MSRIERNTSAEPPSSTSRGRSAIEQSEHERAVLLSLLRAIGEHERLACSERLLGALAEALGQSAAALWVPREGSLTLAGVWCTAALPREPLERALSARRLARGAGLVGRAWQLRTAVGAPSAAENGAGQRAEPARGLRETVAFPCGDGGEVLAIVELYGGAGTELSEALVDACTDLGGSVGRILARRRGELGLSPLSPRELEVLTYAGQGLSVREMALEMTVSPATAKTHLEHIYRKLGARDRSAAVAAGLRAGFIE